MDSLITAAARALAAGDLLGVLKRVGLRGDAPALALRGIAMAQLGDFVRAKALLQNAARAFGPREAVARARCVVAEAEIALVSRDLGWPPKALDAARATLEKYGDIRSGPVAPLSCHTSGDFSLAPMTGDVGFRDLRNLAVYVRRKGYAMIRVIAVVTCGLTVAACSASIPSLDFLKSSPPTAALRFESVPTGAEVKASGQTCRTPCELTVPSNRTFGDVRT
jgi:hypothetical protein